MTMQSSNTKVHKWALDESIDFNLDCNNGCESLLHEAYRNGHVSVVKEVVDRLVRHLGREELHKLCRKTNELTAPPLTLAVLCGRMEIVRVLLDAGFDMNFSNPPWETPSTEAIRYDRDDIARVLLEYSYDTLPQSDEEVEGPREDDTSIECPDASKALECESCLG